jgi:hypothetical protein
MQTTFSEMNGECLADDAAGRGGALLCFLRGGFFGLGPLAYVCNQLGP